MCTSNAGNRANELKITIALLVVRLGDVWMIKELLVSATALRDHPRKSDGGWIGGWKEKKEAC